jgi:hypothetical protein
MPHTYEVIIEQFIVNVELEDIDDAGNLEYSAVRGRSLDENDIPMDMTRAELNKFMDDFGYLVTRDLKEQIEEAKNDRLLP